MAIKVRVQKDKPQRIVPVRIQRAVTGAPALDAPDVDDRGWVNHRAAGLNVDDARGGLFGITVGDTVRLQIVREDIDAGVPLFVSTTGNQVSISGSAGPVGGDGIFKVKADSDTTQGSKIEVRIGGPGGAVICEADAHVFSPLTLNITPHVMTINQAAAGGAGTGLPPTVGGAAMDAAMMTTLFDVVRAVWRPSGVKFNVGAVRSETLNGFLRDDFASQNRGGVSEENIVMGTNQVAGTCNIYFLRFMDRSLGVGVRVETRAGEGMTSSGIMIGVEGSSGDAAGTVINPRSSAGADLVHEIGNDLAHEIGHFLTLPHADNKNGAAGLKDTNGRRRLMHPNNLLPRAVTPLTATSVPRFNDIGYGVGGSGSGHRGCLVTLKDHPNDQSDGEVIDARKRFRSPNLFR